MSTGEPELRELSVVVVVFAGGVALGRLLEALAPQIPGVCDAEVVVARAADVPFIARDTLGGRLRNVVGAAGSSPARLRSLGVAASRGAVVACTEDHCIPTGDWCRAILAAQRAQPGVVGGVIDKETPAAASAWAAYLLDYSRYMSPLPDGPADYVSDCNVSYDRAALFDVEDAWRDEFHETTVHWALASHGQAMRIDPAVVVREDRTVSAGEYLRERFAHGRIFAGTRAARSGGAARARWAILSLALPPVIVARVVGRLRARMALGRAPLAAWPLLAGAAVAWSAGELTGYLAPPRGGSRAP